MFLNPQQGPTWQASHMNSSSDSTPHPRVPSEWPPLRDRLAAVSVAAFSAERLQEMVRRSYAASMDQFLSGQAAAMAASVERFQAAAMGDAVRMRAVYVAGVERMFTALDANRLLTDAVRRQAAEALALVGEAAASGAEVPEDAGELAGRLEETARGFAAAQDGGLPWEEQRRMFYWFIGALVFLMVMQGMVESDPVKELVEDASAALPLAGAAAAAALWAWDRSVPRPPGEEDE